MTKIIESGSNTLVSESQNDTDNPCINSYGEDTFTRILASERKRTERSKRPFMLMLFQYVNIVSGENGFNTKRIILRSLAASIRDIDILGWYKAGEVLGVIFTEIGDSPTGPVVDSILSRIKGALSSNLSPSIVSKLDISIHFFPEILDRGRSSADMALYPDIKAAQLTLRSSFAIKRIIDIAGSLCALICLAPVFLVISIFVKSSSKGPVFFRQTRVGQYGKPFTFLKFRSMYVDNDQTIHEKYVEILIRSSAAQPANNSKDQEFKIKNDPRVTPIGRFIRKTSLDELPQFINVLRGEMSLVGPRPPIPYELENYEIWHRRRIQDMKPGITGIWQVEGRSRTTFNEMVRLDIRYIMNWSIWLDLKLLIRTPWAILTTKGAY